MRFIPVSPSLSLNRQRHRQLQRRFAGVLHDLANHVARLCNLVFRHFKHKLVVHLQQHPPAQVCHHQRAGNPHHRAPDDVGR